MPYRFGRAVHSVDIRTESERRAYAQRRTVYLVSVHAPDGFQSCAEVYPTSRAAYDSDASCLWGWVGQRDASNTSSGYAGWYYTRPGNGALRTTTTRFHSRRLALRQMYAVCNQGQPAPSAPNMTAPPAATVTGATDVRCSECGHTFPAGEDVAARYPGLRRGASHLCPACYTRDLHRVQGYHGWNPGAGPRFGDDADADAFGWELEAHNNTRAWDSNAVAGLVADTFPAGSLYAEEDCTIHGGFESITAPMTRAHYDGLVADGSLAAYLAMFRSHGFVSHEADECGLHVHVARTALGTTVSERDATVLKLANLFESHWDALVALSRRTPSQLRSYARSYRSYIGCSDKPTLDQLEAYTRDDAAGAKRAGLRMFCLNLTNRDTVEIRIARGTLADETFRAWIDLTWALVYAARESSVRTLEAASTLREALGAFVTPTLDAYMTRRGM